MILFCPAKVKAQSISNEGTEFFAVFPKHVPSQARLASFYIFITGRKNSQVRVTAGNFDSGVLNVTANQVLPVPVSRDDAYLDVAGMHPNKAVHVQVLPDQPKVVVYAHIFAGARSAASLILPVEAMGQQYFSMNYDPLFNEGGENLIIVAATEPNTKINIKPRVGAPFTVNLPNVGDVYQYGTILDPTGTEIVADPSVSCKRFAVFSGSSNTTIGATSCAGESSDPLYQQLYPVESWGTTYGFIPFSLQTPSGGATRTRGSMYRVLAKENGTEVKVNGVIVANLNAGEFYPKAYQAVAITTAIIISASKPVAVAQYALSQSCAGGANVVSDPDMVILNPIEYNIKNITVYSSDKENISQQYLNVFIKTSAASSFRINGAAPQVPFKPVIGASGYSYLQLSLNALGTSSFTLSAQDGFNAIAYGFGDHESYAYSAGTSLAASAVLSAIRIDSQQELFNACTKEDFRFKVVLPAIATQLTWKFDTSEPDVVESNPTASPILRNGKTVYEYFFPRTKVFDVASVRNIKVKARYESSNVCYDEEQVIDFIFDVYDPPEAKFTYDSLCAMDSTEFKDKSSSPIPGKPVSKWFWNFGDGSTSSLQNPKHLYATSGTFTVKLVVDNGTGCLSDVSEQNITIHPLPLASFTTSRANCDSNGIEFLDMSQANKGTVSEWFWDFGDSTTSKEQHPRHTFPRVGTYPVKLFVTNSYGCKSNVYSRDVSVIAPSLEAGPDRTILRGGQTTLAIQADGNNLKYKWTPSTGLDHDNIKSPVASPETETLYTVTVTTEEGCILSDKVKVSIIDDIVIPNTFTPNGDGINDKWEIKYLESFPTATINIYTRYGMPVFSSIGYWSPWDGNWKGETLMTGTYYYIITIPIKQKPYSGYVTIIR